MRLVRTKSPHLIVPARMVIQEMEQFVKILRNVMQIHVIQMPLAKIMLDHLHAHAMEH